MHESDMHREAKNEILKSLRDLQDHTKLLLYLNDCFVDLVRIDDYVYYINTLDHVYETWKDHSHCTIGYHLPEGFSPRLQPLQNCADIDSHQMGTDDPIIFTICHYWKFGLDFMYIDVGANYGMTVIPVAGFICRMGRRNRCIAFEPGVSGNLLAYSVDLNGLEDILTVDKRAVHSSTGSVLLHSQMGHSAGDSIVRIRASTSVALIRTTVVPSVKLDDLLSDRSDVIVKIDAEGNDFQVMKGMKRTMENANICILFEMNPSLLDEHVDVREELLQLSHRFELFSIYPDAPAGSSLARIHHIHSIDAFIDLVRSTPRGWIDVLAIKRNLEGYDEFRDRFEERFKPLEI